MIEMMSIFVIFKDMKWNTLKLENMPNFGGINLIPVINWKTEILKVFMSKEYNFYMI